MKENFDNLSLHDKTLLIEDAATHIFSIEFYDHRVHLYSLNNLFIEAYHNIDTKKVDRISVASIGDLDKFLSRIILQPFIRDKRPFAPGL
jgi:uncharacterized protein YutE (UPF0331/DUF86 family)